MRVYRITPLEKKSITAHYEMFRENPDGTISWVNIDDMYRWGQGFIPEDMDMNLPYVDDHTVYCDPTAGWGPELEDNVACYFEFSDDFTKEDKQNFESAYHEGGAGWLYDGEHDWQEEDSSIIVLGPYRVDLCEEDGTVVEADVKMKDRPDPSTQWPFSQEFPKE